VARWICPECGRPFGRVNQGHECAPGLSLEEYFSTGPERERPIFEVVRDHLESLGPVDIEAVSVGIFFKHGRTIVELRPMVKWQALSFVVPRVIEHPRITRKMQASSTSTAHVVRITTPDEIDQQVQDWLTEAYLAAG
jgi:hypothetical protein